MMKVIFKVREGYINTDDGIVLCKKEKASKYDIKDSHRIKEKIYQEKPMIGKIMVETIR